MTNNGDIQKAKEMTAKIARINQDVDKKIKDISLAYPYDEIGKMSFELKGIAKRKSIFLPDDEVAINSFLRKIKDLKELVEPLAEISNGRGKIKNIQVYRGLIADFRSIFFNQDDSIHFQKIGNISLKMLSGTYDDNCLKLRAIAFQDGNEVDITLKYRAMVIAKKKRINKLIEISDLNYLYNGVLQHSDKHFEERYEKDYLSGELDWVILENALLVSNLIVELEPIVSCIQLLWLNGYPSKGSL